VLDNTSILADVAEPKVAAEAAGLRYVCDQEPGFRRRRAGKGFVFFDAQGKRISDAQRLKRIRSIVIPPAWSEVWICPFADGHIQTTGRDARQRKQYRYHPAFREIRESTKYEHMLVFAEALPALRATIREHMARRGLPREKVFATVVQLLETTLIRIGNDDYAKANGSFGLTTLKNRHVAVEGSHLRFVFIGKAGKKWSVAVTDRRVAKVIKACQELPGQELLQYVDEEGKILDVTSADVNSYLREITGRNITAKDFRTLGGTVMAALALNELEAAETAAKIKRNVRDAIERVAARLGNTPTICRKCYVHPEVLNAYLDGSLCLDLEATDPVSSDALLGLSREEAAVIASLRTRLTAKLPVKHAGPGNTRLQTG
jgi:DNA topoisomerase I